jgi:hypothetical protein
MDLTYMRHEQGAIISFASEVAGEEEDEPHTPPRALTALQRVRCYEFFCCDNTGNHRKCNVACLWRLAVTKASAKLARAHVHMCLPSPPCKLLSPSL